MREKAVSIKKIFQICAMSLTLVMSVSVLFGYNFDFVTVRDIVSKVKNKFGSLKTYEAQFRIVSDNMGRRSEQSGVIRYKTSDKLLIDFQTPYGQKILSNGDTMWIYIPSMNVVAEQSIDSGSGLFSASSASGLNRLFSKYHYRFASKEQLEKNDSGEKNYTLALKQKETKSGFRDIKLWISEDYFIKRASGVTSTGKKVDITFSSIKTNIEIPNGVFKFDMPSQARIIKNPMISEE